MIIIDKPYFDQLVQNKQEAYEELVEMSKNNVYITGNILDYSIIKTIINSWA